MEIKKHTSKILVFLINALLIALAVFIIKDKDKNRFSFESEDNTEVVPVDPYILNLQSAVASYRENKLRDLNTSPKSIKQQNVTTTTTTVTPDPVVETSSKSDRKTKTS